MKRDISSGEPNNPKGLCFYNRVLKYMKHKVEELYEDAEKSIVTVRDFNSSVSKIDTIDRDLVNT